MLPYEPERDGPQFDEGNAARDGEGPPAHGYRLNHTSHVRQHSGIARYRLRGQRSGGDRGIGCEHVRSGVPSGGTGSRDRSVARVNLLRAARPICSSVSGHCVVSLCEDAAVNSRPGTGKPALKVANRVWSSIHVTSHKQSMRRISERRWHVCTPSRAGTTPIPETRIVAPKLCNLEITQPSQRSLPDRRIAAVRSRLRSDRRLIGNVSFLQAAACRLCFCSSKRRRATDPEKVTNFYCAIFHHIIVI